MTFPSLRFRAALLLPVLLACRSTEPTPPPIPGEPFVRVDNVRRGLTDASLLAAFTDQSGVTWVGGNVAAVFHRQGSGAWQAEPVPVSGFVTGIWQDGDGHLLLAAGEELLQRSLTAPSWSPVPLDNAAILLELWGLDAEQLFLGGTGGTILRRVGGNWLRAETPVGTEIWGFGGTGPDDLVAVGQSGTILESHDGGATWQAVPSPTTATLFDVVADGAGRMVAVGTGGTIVLRDGDSWELTTSPTTQNLFAVSSDAAGHFFVAGDGGVLFEGSGLGWQPLLVPAVRENFRAITGTPGHRTIAGWYGAIIDEADEWGVSHAGGLIYGVHVPSDGNAIAVGQGGLGFERRGGTWQPIRIPSPASLFDIAGPRAADRLAVGDSGTVMHFYGNAWQREVVPTGVLLRGVWYDGNRALAVGADGTALVRENGVWRKVTSPTTRFLRNVSGPNWNRLLVVGDSGTLLRWDGSRLLPETIAPLNANLRASLQRARGDAFVVGDNGVLLRFNGATWSRLLGPTLNSMRAVHEVDGIVYIAGEFGQIWRQDGESWTAIPVDQLGFWLDLAGSDELIVVGEYGTIGAGVR